MSLYQGNDSLLILNILFAHHGVGLASARLTVSKDADIVALEGVQQHFLSNVFVHSHLRGKTDVLGLRTEINNQPLSHKPDKRNTKSSVCVEELPRCGTSRSNQS